MIKKYLFFLILMTGSLSAAPIRHEFEVGESSLTYYIESPNTIRSYSLMVVLEGSFVEELGPQSIVRLHDKLAQSLLDSSIGMVTMERRGVDGELVDADLFHRYNTPSQRLSDHIQLIQHLKARPPQNWNGELIILGGSEGGPIAIKLASTTDPEACIVLVGCGDQTFAEYIWQVIQSIPSEYKPVENRAAFEAQIEMMKTNPDPTRFWFGQSFLYWADALDQTEYKEFLSLNCPVCVIAGSEDIECASTDRLIAMARQREQDVTYLRIEGMGHMALDPQWDVMRQVLKWLDAIPKMTQKLGIWQGGCANFLSGASDHCASTRRE